MIFNTMFQNYLDLCQGPHGHIKNIIKPNFKNKLKNRLKSTAKKYRGASQLILTNPLKGKRGKVSIIRIPNSCTIEK